jgi:SAM-dependent methyltransferase
MKYFTGKLNSDDELSILDVGSKQYQDEASTGNAEGNSYRELITSPSWQYVGMDLEYGKNVHIVAEDPNHWPLPDESFDVVISGQCIEHHDNLHQWFEELGRVLKPGGRTCIIAPWKWEIHNFPHDYWRILPDGMRYLLSKVARLEVEKVMAMGTPLGSAATHLGVPIRDLVVKKNGPSEVEIPFAELLGADNGTFAEFCVDGDCIGIAIKPRR